MGLCRAEPAGDRREPSRLTWRWSGDVRAVVPQLVAALKDTPRKPSADLDRWIKEDAARIGDLAEVALRRGRNAHAYGTLRGRGDQGVPEERHHDPRRRCHGHLSVDLFAVQTERRRSGTRISAISAPGLPYAIGASVADGKKRPVMLLTSDSSFMFHIAELETAAR